MKKIILLVQLFAVLSIGTLKAQDLFDALRFSQNFYEGTARFTSMGGAFAALGGDMTTLSINPAGVGVYRGMEFTMTPAISYSSTSTSYLNTTGVKDSQTKFGFSNIGYASPIYISNSSKGLVSMNFGIAYNKLNNFNSRTNTIGVNAPAGKSMVNVFRDLANGEDLRLNTLGSNDSYGVNSPRVWPAIMAWDNLLIDHDGTSYFIPNSLDLKTHNKYAQTVSEGSTGEYAISMGGNISHKFYFGLTVGIQDINYKSTKYYEEVYQNPTDLSTHIFDQYYKTSGYGFNVKGGVIYRPITDLRLALAVHSPTFLDLTDEYEAYQRIDVVNQGGYHVNSPRNFYDYRINTPYKFIAGAAYTFKSYGLISVDYELVDYSSIRMKEHADYHGPNGFSGENEVIKNSLKAASNLRVGIEGNLPAGLSLRAGYSFYGSPYKEKNNLYVHADNGNVATSNYSMGIGDNVTSVYSAGLGYRFRVGFVDFGYSLTDTKVEYVLDDYIYGVIPTVTTKTKFNRFALTLGLKF